jgi:hypothetical protein
MFGLLHLAHGAAERTKLLFQAGAVDRDLAGVVDRAIEQVGADADLFLRCAYRSCRLRRREAHR